MSRWMVAVAGVLGLLGVALGAFAAHGLESRLAEQGLEPVELAKRIDNCETGARYHMLHSLALLSLGLSTAPVCPKRRAVAAACFLLGIALFSGGLYSISLFGVLGHWAIVPAGGLCFMVGWFVVILLALGAPPQADARRDP